ncbi:MAG TPA: hypothetical protein PL048_08365 [Leptospiraceae bacterium]|nr:hypothetical protein [Leptospiraceae bacterium]HNF25276.1 hypothetical protein [Leptospiraceae bacterium]
MQAEKKKIAIKQKVFIILSLCTYASESIVETGLRPVYRRNRLWKNEPFAKNILHFER